MTSQRSRSARRQSPTRQPPSLPALILAGVLVLVLIAVIVVSALGAWDDIGAWTKGLFGGAAAPTPAPGPTAVAVAASALEPTPTPRPTDPPRPTASPTAAPTAVPTAVPTASPTSSPTNTPAPTATPAPTDTPPPATPVATATPASPGSLIVETVVRPANRTLETALADIDNNWEELQRYWCGESARSELATFRERITTYFGTQVTAEFSITDPTDPVQEPDNRYRFSQTESWTFSSATVDRYSEQFVYTYWMRETGDPDMPYCIDEYQYALPATP